MINFLLALAAVMLPLGVEAELKADITIETKASEPLSEGSQFQAGSLSKYVCTLAVLKLSESGLVALDAPLSETLTQYQGTSATELTVRDLLANRSGLPDDLLPAFRADPSIAQSHISALDASNRFAAGPINSEKPWSYDLGNWIIAKAVIEQASGQELGQFASKAIFAPAGLSNTRFDHGVPVLANSPDPAGSVRPLPKFLECAGGLVSTPADLLRLVDWAYQGGLSPESIELLHTLTTPDESYTLGGRIKVLGDKFYSWQSGSNGPYKTQLVYEPATGLGWAGMSAGNDDEALSQARQRWISSNE